MKARPGQTLSHYRLVEKIGEGGMGVIYKARDTHLDRDAALKVLTQGVLADEAARKRFRKEALALSKLNHPNIETVFDFDTQDGVDFLVMEFIPGTTLDKKLTAGPLPEKEIARLGAQLGDGISAAHDRGVLHRDLKPANLRVMPDGRLKILDFGLAKLLRPVDERSQAETATETRGLVGTPPYMAPEQLGGETVDTRTDIWALGVVLYEMASGRRPFSGQTATELSDAILHRSPVTPRAVNARISSDLERVILKCLEKAPENRYQSAKEVMVDLRRLVGAGETVIAAGGARPLSRWLYGMLALVVMAVIVLVVDRNRTPPAPPLTEASGGKIMLAVLPFENLSADPEQEYFSDGMTEEMIARLGRVQPEVLGVIARTSAMHYKNTTKRVDEIGHELGVEYLLEGSVRRAGERVRITAQLIQVSDQTHLWAENYERDLADVFALQNDVAERIAGSLTPHLLPRESAGPSQDRAVDSIAYDTYLKGLHHLRKRDRESLTKALDLFLQTIAKDPSFALGHARLALAYLIHGTDDDLGVSQETREAMLLKAEISANDALKLDSELAHPHAVLGDLRIVRDWDLPEARREYERAIELDPNYALAHHYYATFLLALGELNRSFSEEQRANELDPLSPLLNQQLGRFLIRMGRPDEAISKLQTALELGYRLPRTHQSLASAYLMKGMQAEAIDEFQQALVLAGGSPEEVAAIRRSFEHDGIRGYREWELERLIKQSETTHVSSMSFAVAYANLGENKQALIWLNRCYEARDSRIIEAGYRTAFDDLRTDVRFQELLRRAGLRSEQG